MPAKTAVSSSTDKAQHAFFPYARYTSVTSLLLWPSLADPDRPETQFKDALTNNPVITLAWIVAGLVVLQKLGRAAVFTSCVALVFHATIVLFGAPSASHLPHTFLLAIVLALLSVFAPAYALGYPSFSSNTSSFITRLNWTRLFAELSKSSGLSRCLSLFGEMCALADADPDTLLRL
ncbi:uncharacterized protein F5147DRAFT_776000 [Suillus discolor]|uniref:Uncharacterized protein n=1 Tax=Suillus discolor TaxID=1912936 RepID=A0A9P7F2D9_9AGAM|nr:uncharacterized protein F5147DRAFT_776000 [Suillus discolor]KAG2103458.1 hypothetical protein F5147DRAFT_776000 [Suillus discolor]